MDNKNKKKTIIMIIIFSVIFAITGGTFAYFNWQTSEEQKTNVTFRVTQNFSCAADGGGNITSNDVSLAPATCTNSTHAIKRTVTVKPTTNNTDITMQLWLNVNALDSGLSNSQNFKYALTTSDTSCETGVVSTGTFNEKKAGDKVYLLEENFSTTTTKTYYLYIWLDKEETSSTTMNQNFELSLGGDCTNTPDESTLISDSLIQGTWRATTDNTIVREAHFYRATVATPILLNKGDSITVKQNTTYVFGYFFLQYNETNQKYYFDTNPGWQTALSRGDVTITATEDCYLITNWKTTGTERKITDDDIEAIKPLIKLNRVYTEKQPGNSEETEENKTDYPNVQYLLSKEVTIDTYPDCKIVTIPATLSNGTNISPKVTLTASTVGGSDMKSALEYATNNKMAVVMNAGLFNTSTKVPQGQTIIDGISITNSPMTDDMGTAISDEEAYPLCIGSSGELSAPYPRSIDTSTMITDGVKYAVTGWLTLIEGGVAKYENFNEVEIVHKNSYSRQVIGQYEDGDYFILTTTSADKTGMTYAAINELLLSLSKKVSFAYSLDGGGSAETVVDRTQINTIYEGTYGRKVPTLIYFDER